MSKTKISAKSALTPDNKPDNQGEIPTIQAKTTKKSNTGIRIVFLGTCPKLTTRGRGDLSYELGIDEATGDSYIRISANASSGAFSNEWIAIDQIRTLLKIKAEPQKPFSAVTMESLFTRRSANNYGYLAAVLRAEGALTVLPGKPVVLSPGEWEPVLQKIKTLKDKGISLTDHIAIAAQQKAEKRAQLVENMRNAKTAKAAEKSKDAKNAETEAGDQVPNPTDEENADS